jgi:hypothetical protein
VRRVALNTIYNQTKTKAEQKRYRHTRIQIGEISQEKRKQNKKTYYTKYQGIWIDIRKNREEKTKEKKRKEDESQIQ